MKRPLQITTTALVSILILTASWSTQTPEPPTAPRVHHIVICWLKDPADPSAANELIEVSKSFTSIPGVTSVNAAPIPLPIVKTKNLGF